jgi:hypothetical protein
MLRNLSTTEIMGTRHPEAKALPPQDVEEIRMVYEKSRRSDQAKDPHKKRSLPTPERVVHHKSLSQADGTARYSLEQVHFALLSTESPVSTGGWSVNLTPGQEPARPITDEGSPVTCSQQPTSW